MDATCETEMDANREVEELYGGEPEEMQMDRDGAITPDEVIELADLAAFETLPKKSKAKYQRAYGDFKKWQIKKGTTSHSERVLSAYFKELSVERKSSTLWSYYSMLKATMRIHENVDIGKYLQITAFLKAKGNGYEPVQAKTFTEENIAKFLMDASDEVSLDVKVACVFGIFGGLRCKELSDMEIGDIEEHDELLLIKIPKNKTNAKRSFTVSGIFCHVVKKYSDMRPQNCSDNRFFRNFQKGKCTRQAIGVNKFYGMPTKIATFLKLENPQLYTGHSFRRTSVTILANCGADLEALLRHGGWKNINMPARYIDDARYYKERTGDMINKSIIGTSAIISSPCTSEQSNNETSVLNQSSFVGNSFNHSSVSGMFTSDDSLHEIRDSISVSTQIIPQNKQAMLSQTVSQTYKQEMKKFHFENCKITMHFTK